MDYKNIQHRGENNNKGGGKKRGRGGERNVKKEGGRTRRRKGNKRKGQHKVLNNSRNQFVEEIKTYCRINLELWF